MVVAQVEGMKTMTIATGVIIVFFFHAFKQGHMIDAYFRF